MRRFPIPLQTRCGSSAPLFIEENWDSLMPTVEPHHTPSRPLIVRAAIGLSVLLLCLALHGGKAFAQADTLRPAAVVNDEVISVLDLVMRTRLAILGAGVDDTPETRRRIARQVLLRLIDERLQMQEAARLSIAVTDEQVNQALEQIANQNNLTGEQFIQALRNAQILPSALLDQIRAELTWQNVVQTSLRREVEIRPQEVDAVVERILGGADQRQYRVAEIFLAIPDIQQEEEVLQNAQRLVQQAREGANFSGLARQFSESSTANLGGDLGWMSGGQLQEELNRVLVSMSPGQVSDPIRTLTGFTILLLRDVRATTEDSIDRDQIEQSLAQERLNQLAQRRLQELRRSASIDVRI